jgi:hypothetical protein
MSQHDEHLPEDLRDIAARLSAARVTPTALELDELRRRVHGRAQRAPQRRGLVRGFGRNVVAVALTSGLLLSSGVGVVLACTDLGRGDGPSSYPSWPIKLQNASWCEYNHKWEGHWSWNTRHGKVYVTVDWDCKHLTGTITCNSRPISWQWGGGGYGDVNLTSVSTNGPSGSTWLKVTADGTTGVANFTYSH